MGRQLFWLTPWWVFASIACGFGALVFTLGMDYLAQRDALNEAIATPPTRVIPSQFDPKQHSNAFNEVDFEVIWNTEFHATIPTSRGPDIDYILFVDPEDPTIFVVVKESNYILDGLIETLAEEQNSSDPHIITGVLTSARRLDIRQGLKNKNLSTPSKLFIVEPFYGDRVKGLEGVAFDAGMIVIIGAVFTLAMAAASIAKFRKWRGRVRQKRKAKPVRKTVNTALPPPDVVQSAAPQNGQKQPSKDKFDDSPIISSRRR